MSANIGSQLLLDEMSDLALYRALRPFSRGDLAATLDGFIATEIRHVAFWRQFFALDIPKINLSRQLSIRLLTVAARLGGPSVTSLILEARETHGVKKYLTLWRRTTDTKLNLALRSILEEELLHEDEAVTATSGRKIDAATIRNAFLGFNDGSVEILGAVNGLAAAFGNPALVAAAGLTVACAGALSMASGAYLSTHSEQEVLAVEQGKKDFLGAIDTLSAVPHSPLRAAALVGSAYLLGAAAPILPFLLGAQNPWWSIVLSGTLILVVSAVLAFLSGMHIARRIAMNGTVIVITVVIAYAIGTLVDHFLLA